MTPFEQLSVDEQTAYMQATGLDYASAASEWNGALARGRNPYQDTASTTTPAGAPTQVSSEPQPSSSGGSSADRGTGPQYIPGATLTDADSAGLPAGTVGGNGVGVGQAAPPPVSAPPAAGMATAPAPYDAAPAGQYGGGGYTGGSYTGGGSGGSYGATGTPSMPQPGGGQSEWSRILHTSGALQNPAGGIPFNQYPGMGAQFDPYMQARGWSSPANSTGADPTSSVGGGMPNASINQQPVMAPPVGVSPTPTPQFGSSPTQPPANPETQASPSLGMNMNSPAAMAPMESPAMAPMTPPPVGGMTPEEAALRAASMNQDLRNRFGGF